LPEAAGNEKFGKGDRLQSISHAWRAMRHRNFRLYFGGQSISVIGTWMTRVATSWLVYRLTKSSLMLGTVNFAGQIPTLFAPVAGVFVDRLDRRQVLLWTQALAMVQSLALAALVFSGRITIPWIFALSAMQGIINSFDMPGRQSFLIKMVDDRADLGNAIAINSSMATMARLIGPMIAGIIIGFSSEAWCFLIDGVSYIAVLYSLFAMRVEPMKQHRVHASMWVQLKEGWHYVSTFLPVRTILLVFSLNSLMGIPFVVLMPIFAVQVLHGGAHTLGFLMSATGLGALASALSLAARKNVRGLFRMIPLAGATFGLGLIGFGLSHVFWISWIMLVFVGMGMMQGMAASNTLIQTLVSEDKRGRVMSYYTLGFTGMAPFGALLAGTLAHALPTKTLALFGSPFVLTGEQLTIIFNGSIVVAGALWFSSQMAKLRPIIRPIYQEMGIIPATENLTEELAEEEIAAEQIQA
jgi:MFS family permease